MQATQNGSDLWLSYWVSHSHKERLRLGGPLELGSPALPSMAPGQAGGALQGLRWTWSGAYIPLRFV